MYVSPEVGLELKVTNVSFKHNLTMSKHSHVQVESCDGHTYILARIPLFFSFLSLTKVYKAH